MVRDSGLSTRLARFGVLVDYRPGWSSGVVLFASDIIIIIINVILLLTLLQVWCLGEGTDEHVADAVVLEAWSRGLGMQECMVRAQIARKLGDGICKVHSVGKQERMGMDG